MTQAIVCAQRAGESLMIYFKSGAPCDPSETSFVLRGKKRGVLLKNSFGFLLKSVAVDVSSCVIYITFLMLILTDPQSFCKPVLFG